MKWGFGFEKEPVLGIDISDTAIKVAALTQRRTSYCLEAYARVSLAKHVVIEKEIKDIAAVAISLQEALQQLQTKAKWGAVALPDTLVITKKIIIAQKLPAAEIEEQIMQEAVKHIPYPLNEVYLDYNLLKPEQKIQPVFIAAARTEIVTGYLQVLEKAGAKTKLIDIEAFALHKACMNFIPAFKQANIAAVIDISTVRTTITVYADRVPIFTRTAFFGLEFLIKNIPVTELNLSVNSNSVYAAFYDEFKQNLLQHVKRGIQFYTAAANNKNIELMIVTGASAKLKGLVELLAAEFNYTVVAADPAPALTFSEKINPELIVATSSSLMAALGLALRSFD